MIEINWRFMTLAIGLVIVIVLQLINMKERKVFTMIQKLIEDNTRTNDKLNDTLKTHKETMKEQSANIRNFERQITTEIGRIQGAIAKQ